MLGLGRHLRRSMEPGVTKRTPFDFGKGNKLSTLNHLAYRVTKYNEPPSANYTFPT